MKQIVKWAMVCAQDKIDYRKNSFEFYGFDFILDSRGKPWLLEINKTPAMDHSTDITKKLVPEVVEDIFKVILDYPENKKADTGKFEMYYKAPFKIDKRNFLYEQTNLAVDGYGKKLRVKV
jgi:tubulin monoglycylase TTLL3/8